MNSNPARMVSTIVLVTLVAISVFPIRPVHSSSASQDGPTLLLLEKEEGERRIWRDPPPGDFILKVSPKNNGSQHLVMLTEDMEPGGQIPTHKHLGQDEILYLAKGTIHVHLGDQERDLHAGGTVFIPAYTWVTVKNIGTEAATLVAVFSAPGFEDHLRCESVLPGEQPTPVSAEEHRKCDLLGHVSYKGREEK